MSPARAPVQGHPVFVDQRGHKADPKDAYDEVDVMTWDRLEDLRSISAELSADMARDDH